jgi:hypothetical protein
MYLLMLTLPKIVGVFWNQHHYLINLRRNQTIPMAIMSKEKKKKMWINPMLQEETVSTINSGSITANVETTSQHT